MTNIHNDPDLVIELPPTKEQKQWLWEQCGFKPYYVKGRWRDPFNKDILHPLPRIDLNNLFKYAVPKLRGHDIYLSIHHEEPDTFMCAIHLINDDNYRPIAIRDKDPALALFWAVFLAFGGNR